MYSQNRTIDAYEVTFVNGRGRHRLYLADVPTLSRLKAILDQQVKLGLEVQPFNKTILNLQEQPRVGQTVHSPDEGHVTVHFPIKIWMCD